MDTLAELINSCCYELDSTEHKKIYNKNFGSNVELIVSKFRNNNDDYNDCSEPVIEIHSEQPGYGKTQSMVDYINSNPHERHLVLGPSHDFLNELKERLGIRTKIFRGFERGCSRLQRGDKRAVDLYKKLGNSSPTLICKVLRCKGRCSYRNQFSQLKNKTCTNCVFMPLHFLFYTDIDFNSFDNIFVDEGIKSNSFSNRLKADYLNEILKLNIKNEDDKAVLNSVRDCILDNDHVNFYELTNEFSRIVYNHNISVLNDGRGKWDNICNINVNELYYNLIFNKIGNLNVGIMWEWIIFYKQMISWKNIVYNCASFNRYTFTHHLRMFREIFPEYKPEINLHKTQFSNPGTKIIRMSKDRTIYKNWMLSYYDEYSDKLWKLVKNNKYNHNMRVCFLTYKYMIENKLDIKGLSRENNIFGSQAFWFGAGHGINTYEGFDVLIVFGDYLAGSHHYKNHFLTYYPRDDIPDFDDIEKGLPSDKRLLEKFHDFQLDIYDAVHRLRPLKNDITIYWFGSYIPPELFQEFDVV